MAPRPIMRWKSIWLGILMLGFLAFCWVRSAQTVDWLSWRISSDIKPVWVRQAGGKVGFGVEAEGRGRIGLGYVTLPIGNDEQPAPAAAWIISSPYATGICLTHWFLILLFLVPWSTFLALRWRRQRILTKAHDAAPAP